ncbi:hypothetical protein PVK62_17355 [Aliivibrio sp. S3MY1]|uniref:hypothetical protein n=1 Tax=unclassified Aliivibrio TaxID=2645654 RepID=UPI002379E3E2|nr:MULTISPECIES: hypothetical protein [unclassified Aliivibrio]MDD9197588.1 hypothetical protein [Aliivibrio sp. S3MY1]MDD9200841.1 hypothetical protein [Aliivibrio sp. S2MY1]
MSKEAPNDVAALAGAATAASVSVFISSGAFGILGIGIGLTLITLVLSYASSSAKNPKHQIAFSVVMGQLIILILAPMFELFIFWNQHRDLYMPFLWYLNQMDVLTYTEVTSSTLFIAWLIASISTYLYIHSKYKKK